jgi:hypothetical protein
MAESSSISYLHSIRRRGTQERRVKLVPDALRAVPVESNRGVGDSGIYPERG